MPERTIHEGRNVKRIGEMLGIKQETLTSDLNWRQQKISLIKQKEQIEDSLLREIANVLKVPAEAIKNFHEEKAIYNIQNNFDGSTLNNSSNYQYTY